MANLTFKSIGATTVALNKVGSPTQISLQYSTDGTNWQNYTVGDQISLSNNQFVSFSGANEKFSLTNAHYYNFASTGEGTLLLSGDVMSLVSGTSIEYPYAFCKLFLGNDRIVDASNMTLSAENISKWCYANMFKDCTNLSAAPSTLPACTLKQWCYEGMFAGCSNLTAAPSLPATTLAKYCYYAMFYNCKRLCTAPFLGATTLAEFCYDSMFYGCTCLGSNGSRVPIQGNALKEGCCANMFTNCQNLSNFGIYAHTWDEVDNTGWVMSANPVVTGHCNATNIWSHGLPSTGFFEKIKELPVVRGESRIPQNWNLGEDYPFIIKSAGTTWVQLNKVGSPEDNEFIICRNRYSNSDTYGAVSSYTPGTSITLHDQDFITFRGLKPHLSKDGSNFYHFDTGGTGKLALSGKLNSLSRGDTSTDNVYRGLFSGCTNIANAANLWVTNTTLGTNAYTHMFYNCTGLSAIPTLSSKNLSYGCYWGMFQNCTGLSSINANILPASGLANACYRQMFSGCKNLKTVPVTLLPATTLTPSCYFKMFENCSGLLYTPTLTAANLTDSCYFYMFSGCSNISAFNVGFTSWGTNYDTLGWVANAKSTGIFIKPVALRTQYDMNAIPNNWAVLVKSGAWLVYSEPYNGHAVGDHYTGGNPYGYS